MRVILLNYLSVRYRVSMMFVGPDVVEGDRINSRITILQIISNYAASSLWDLTGIYR